MKDAPAHPSFVGVMNDAKWAEVRIAMLRLGAAAPDFQVKLLGSRPADRDGEWYYHFRLDPYREFGWVRLRPRRPEHHQPMLDSLRTVRVPGRVTDDGAIVYGHVPAGTTTDYI